MGAIAIDVNNMLEVNAVGIRALSNALGDDGARAFINQFKYGTARAAAPRPSITATRIAEILEQSRAEAEARRNTGEGDYTAEKKNRPQESFDVVAARIMEADARERTRQGVTFV